MFFSVTDKAIETFDIWFLANINTIKAEVIFFIFTKKNLRGGELKKMVLQKIGHNNCSIRDRDLWFL